MTKITAEHLARAAFVYVRQSTSDQLLNNHESRLRQYGLADRARALGWTTVEVIDDDLGRSGSGISRPGFEKLLAAICEGRVGAVVSIEASRLARNGRDWHTLLEFCGLVGTVIVDEDGVYDPRHPNDRLLHRTLAVCHHWRDNGGRRPAPGWLTARKNIPLPIRRSRWLFSRLPIDNPRWRDAVFEHGTDAD